LKEREGSCTWTVLGGHPLKGVHSLNEVTQIPSGHTSSELVAHNNKKIWEKLNEKWICCCWFYLHIHWKDKEYWSQRMSHHCISWE
jgi:hypothetical protein